MFSNSLVTLSHRNGAVFSYTSSSSWYAFLQRNWVSWIIYHLPPTLGVSTIHSFFFFFSPFILRWLKVPCVSGKKHNKQRSKPTNTLTKAKQGKNLGLTLFPVGSQALAFSLILSKFLGQVAFQSPGSTVVSPSDKHPPEERGCQSRNVMCCLSNNKKRWKESSCCSGLT